MYRTNCNLSEKEINEKAKELIAKMSVKEKVFLLSGNWQMMRDSIKYKRSYNPVPVESHGNKRLGINRVMFTDGPRGVVMGNSTCFPVSMARAASFDRELEYEIGEAIGREARAGEANYFAGVCINLLMHPAGGRAQESYGEDPYLVGEMGSTLVKGVQKHNVMACAKHYAVNNMENMRFHVNVNTDERTLREVYLPHFKKCVDAGCASLMGSYNRFRKDQASESHYLLTKILREDWGFEGFTITDFIFALRDGAKAMNAGMDMEMPIPVHYGKELLEHVQNGEVSMERIDEACMRLLTTQLSFENTPDPEKYDKSVIACDKHIALAKRAAKESMVLIKNDNVLPLSKNIKKLLVIGHLADVENIGDHGSSRVYPPYTVTALQGLKDYLGEGVEIIHVDEKDIEKAKEIASSADAVIIIAGNDYNDEGEYVVPDESINAIEYMAHGFINNNHPFIGKMMLKAAAKSDKAMASYTSSDEGAVGGDRASLSLRPAEIEAIREVGAINRNTVVALVSGSMIITSEWEESAAGILYSWYSGMEGGRVLAEILFGEVNPSGKLPFSIPKKSEDLGHFDRFDEEVTYSYYHGYRRLDHENIKPSYAFGHGLTYTTFTYGEPTVAKTEEGYTVTVPVTNDGDRTGTEIVQTYVSVIGSKVERHEKELKGFERVTIAPNETANVTMKIPYDELKYYDVTENKFVLEDAEYHFLVGPASDKLVTGKMVE